MGRLEHPTRLGYSVYLEKLINITNNISKVPECRVRKPVKTNP